MPFTSVPAAQIELLQNVVDGDIYIPGFSRRAFLNGATAGLLSLAPPLTMVSNLLTVAAPVRSYDLATFAGLGLSIETTVVAGNFPVVASRDVQVMSTAVTGQLWTYPNSRQLGQLLVMAIATAALTTITTPTGWTLVQSQAGTESRTAVYERVVDGLEPADLTITFGTASAAVIRTWMIDIGDGGVEAVAGINDSAAGTSLDLATISPTWAVAEATSTLYIAILGLADDVTVSGFPAGYTVTGQDVSASATANLDCALAYAERNALGSSENPGAFTYAAARSTGHVIAIKPKVTARLNWDGVRVDKAGSAVSTRRVINVIDGTGISSTVVDNPGTGAVDITIAATGGGAADWATVLSIGHVSGANNAHIDVGQILSFGIEGSLPPTGQIRSSTDLTMRAVGGIELVCTTAMQLATIGNIPIQFVTNAVQRFQIRGDGAWSVQGSTGTNGQLLQSTGGTTTPIWATVNAGHVIRDDGTGMTQRAALNFTSSTTILAVLTDDAGNAETEVAMQIAGFTGGDVTSSANSLVLTIANNAVTNAKAADMAANTIKANPTAGATDPSDLAISADSFPARVGGNLVSHPFATLFGTYLSYSAGVADWIGLDVRVNTGALTGTRHRINVIGSSPISVAAADDGVNDEVDITISIASIPLTSLTTVAALTVIANATNAVATPTAVASSADDTVFRRTATTLNWGQLTVGMAPNDVWTYAKIQNVSATSRFLGRITAAAGDIEELTGTQATTLLNVFTSGLQGLAPASGGGTANFLRADGTFAQAAHTIRANGGGFTLRLGLNFANTTSIIAAGADDAGANETDITFQRAALTGEVTAGQNSNATTIVRSTTFSWTGAHDFTGAVAFTVGVSSDVSVASTTGGLWLSAGHATPVVSPSVSNGDVLINAANGAGLFARATPITNVGLSTVELGADGDIVLNADSGIAITAGSGATGFPITAVTTGNLDLRADAAINVTSESGNILMASGADVNISATGGVFIPSPLETGDITITGAVVLASVISPAALAAQTNNFNPSGFSACNTLRITLTGAQNLTGILGIANKVIQLVNADTTDNLTLIHDNGAAPATSSTTTNRFLLPGNTNRVLLPQAMVKLWYDNTSTRWRADMLL